MQTTTLTTGCPASNFVFDLSLKLQLTQISTKTQTAHIQNVLTISDHLKTVLSVLQTQDYPCKSRFDQSLPHRYHCSWPAIIWKSVDLPAPLDR